MTRDVEFIVNGFMTGYAGELHVIGRCGDVPIEVGDSFDHLRNKFDGEIDIVLRVVAIEAYGRNLQSLGQGMTARLTVQGEDVELLRPNSVLLGHPVSPGDANSPADTSSIEHSK